MRRARASTIESLSRRLTPAGPIGPRSTGIAAVVVSCTAWGCVGILVRALPLAAVTIAGFRLGFASLGVLAGGLTPPGRVQLRPRGQWRRLLLLGALMAANWWLFILAFQLTDIGITVVLSFTWPVWAALFDRSLDIARPDRATVAALGVSMLGIALLGLRHGIELRPQDLAGMAAALATALSFAVMVMSSRSIHASISSATVNFWQSLIAAALLMPFALLGLHGRPLHGKDIAILVVLGAVLTGLGGTLFLVGMRTLSSAETAVFSYLEPLSATVLAAVFLHENPGAPGFVGIVLIVGAGLWVAVAQPAASQPPSTARKAPVT